MAVSQPDPSAQRPSPTSQEFLGEAVPLVRLGGDPLHSGIIASPGTQPNIVPGAPTASNRVMPSNLSGLEQAAIVAASATNVPTPIDDPMLVEVQRRLSAAHQETQP